MIAATTPTSPVAASLVLFATAVAIGAFVVLHLLPTGLSPRRNAVSHYGITRFRLGYRVMTVSIGFGGLALAVAAGRAFSGGRPRGQAVGLLVGFGLARAVISWFPMDAPGAERTRHGSIHAALAAVTFTSITLAAFKLHAVVAGKDPTASGLLLLLQISSWLLLVAVATTAVSRRARALRSWFGAAERLIYVGTFLLLVGSGIALR